jgi:hypothetical protein
MWSFKKYVIIMVTPPWLYGIACSVYANLVASDNIRSYVCSPVTSLHPELAVPILALTNLMSTIGVIVVYSIGIYKSIKTGEKCLFL